MTKAGRPPKKQKMVPHSLGFRPTVLATLRALALEYEKNLTELVNDACLFWIESNPHRAGVFERERMSGLQRENPDASSSQ